jgi:hypothetical protein
MIMTTKTRIKIDRDALESAVTGYIAACDSMQCHIHLRVDAEGNAYTDEDAGYCVSTDEYNREPGAAKTLLHQQGWGQNHLDEDWASTDDGMESVRNMILMIEEDLKRDGYEIEWI